MDGSQASDGIMLCVVASVFASSPAEVLESVMKLDLENLVSAIPVETDFLNALREDIDTYRHTKKHTHPHAMVCSRLLERSCP